MKDEMVVSINEYNDRVVYNIAAMNNKQIIRMIKDSTSSALAPSKETHEIYDEVDMEEFLNLARELNLGKDDVFIDIRSGKGRLVMLMTIKMDLKSHVGIDIVHDRHHIAVKAQQTLRDEGVSAMEKTVFENKDISDCGHLLSGCGLVFANNKKFKPEINELIKSLLVSNIHSKYLVVTENFYPRDSHPM
ncbi:unnamed protein product [Aphanomyces euteiches]